MLPYSYCPTSFLKFNPKFYYAEAVYKYCLQKMKKITKEDKVCRLLYHTFHEENSTKRN